MNAITVELPHSLRKKLEELAKKEGFSLEQFMASAASEKLSAMLQIDFLENEARQGSREAFEKFLASVPDVESVHPDDVIK
ncbi:MAG: toxin-antitoxin system HicB family antitoxin [Saprospiraceae bacterium]|nr:toxin-antitoxin system HicB family antitoxin [Pyrinomonadaceae bacterium]